MNSVTCNIDTCGHTWLLSLVSVSNWAIFVLFYIINKFSYVYITYYCTSSYTCSVENDNANKEI